MYTTTFQAPTIVAPSKLQRAYRFSCCVNNSDALSTLGRFRAARPNDSLKIIWLAAREGMNPLIGSMDNFVVFENTDGKVIAGGQVRDGEPGEISTVVVETPFRSHGIGGALVGELVRTHSKRDLCLITLARHAPFYERHGFRICEQDEIPPMMRAEMEIGKIVVSVVEPGMTLIAMTRKKDL